MNDIKFKDIRNLLSRIDKISICDKESLQYNNYFNINEVPESCDELYVHGIGIIDSEIENDVKKGFEKHIEIVTFKLPKSYTSRFEKMFNIGDFFYQENNGKDIEYYQIINLYDENVDLIKLDTINSMPANALNSKDLSRQYYLYGSNYENISIIISDKSNTNNMITNTNDVYTLYKGEIYSIIKDTNAQ